MTHSDRYSVLFEPVQIGPVTAKNRFYQVPHCSGLGHLRPQAEAAVRAMKAGAVDFIEKPFSSQRLPKAVFTRLKIS